MTDLLRDLRHAARTLVRQWTFAATVVLTLALGVGATTLVYAAVNRVMLHPLPFKGEDRLVYPWRQSGPFLTQPSLSMVDAWRHAAHTLEGLEAFAPVQYNATDGQQLHFLDGMSVEPGFLAFLGLAPALGRAFNAGDVRERVVHVAMLSDGYWRSAYGARRDIIGRTIQLDSLQYTVVGIMPKRLAMFSGAAVWTPLALADSGTSTTSGLLARLRPGVTIAAAQRELRDIASRIADPQSLRQPVVLKRPRDMQVPLVPRTLWVLLGVVIVVLVIACTNVVLLLLARAAAREQETAVRVSLGATRWRLVRQAFAETAILAGAGTGAGVLLAWVGVRAVATVGSGEVAELARVTIDGHVLLLALTLTIGVAFVTAMIPMLRATAGTSDVLLRSGAIRGFGVRAMPRMHSAFVILELALSLVLLVGLGLLVRSLVDRQRTNLGFNAHALLTVRVALAPSQYPGAAARGALESRLLERVRTLPQVQSATIAAAAPPHYGIMFLQGLEVDAASAATTPALRVAALNEVQPDYFRVMGIRLISGRAFTTEENRDRASVVILSHGLAERLFPGGTAVGQQLRRRAPGSTSLASWTTVVGVVQDVAAMGISGNLRTLQWYEPYDESPRAAGAYVAPLGMLVVRASGDPDALVPLLRQQVRSVDPTLPPSEITKVASEFRQQLAAPRFITMIMATFAVLAVVLAAVGLFGVLSYAVGMRAREMGLRMALGADASDVRALVVRQGMRRVVIGLVLGVVCAFFATRAMTALLYGVTPHDVGSFAGAAVILVCTALLACWLPARRATRVDPMVVLRE
jgi:predicted permease